MTSVLAALTHERERSYLLRTSSLGKCVRSCATLSSLEQELSCGPIDTLVYEPSFGLAHRPDIVRLIERLGVSIIIRLPLTPPAILELVTLIRVYPVTRVSIRTHEGLDAFTTSIAEREGDPIGTVVLALSCGVASEALQYLVGALALGRGRTSGNSHADTFGVSRRTLQAQHQRLALPYPRRMRAWGQAVWAAWRLERLADCRNTLRTQ